MSEKKEAAPAAAPKAKRGKFLIIGIVAALVLAGGGGGAFWWFTRSAKAAGAEAEKKPAPVAEAGGVVPLDTFLVNLADKNGSRYLRTTLKLVVADEKTAEKLTKNEIAITRVRSAILELLSTETAEQLVTAEGKSELKKAIGERVSPIVGTEISDVLFADFVVQF
jgi:flagellar FliL protein